MSNLYKKTYRVLMIDQHFPDAPYITFEKFSAEEQLKKCIEARFDSIHITTKCHWGYSYYNTNVGVKHPALSKRDMVAELVQECRKTGVEAIAYYSVLFDNMAVRRHPEWCFIDRERKPRIQIRPGAPSTIIWRNTTCINTGYREYCLNQIQEIASSYDIDGLFLDIFGQGEACYCDACLRLYAEHSIDPYSSEREAVFDMKNFYWSRWAEFLQEIRHILKTNRTDVSLSLNGGPLSIPWSSLKQVDWPYSEGGEYPYLTVALRGTGMPYYQCGIPAGNDTYDAWPKDLVQIMTSTILAHGARTLFFFMQGRSGDGRFEDAKYNFMRGINVETEAKQQFVERAVPLTTVAVYYSEPSLLDPGSWAGGSDCIKKFMAMIDIFRQIHIPCEFLPNWRCRDNELSQFQFVVVPEITCLSDAEVGVFQRFVEDGGNLLVTGETGLRNERNRPGDDFALTNLLGIRNKGVCKKYEMNRIGGYLRFDKHPFFSVLRKTDYLMPGNFIQVECMDAEPIAYIAEPVGMETPDSFIGWFSLPPGSKAQWPAVTIVRRGKGNAIYCAAPLGRYAADKVRWPASFIEGVVKSLGIGPGISIIGPKIALEVTYFRQGERLLIHLLNQSVRYLEGEVVPIKDVRILIDDARLAYKKARIVYPEEKTPEVERKGSVTEINIPSVEIHTIVAIDK